MTERAEKNGHPCPKPETAWSWLVDKFSKPDETVIDPFKGNGTGGVACIKLDRHFIGIERETHDFDLACKRIEEAYDRPNMFVMPQRHDQPKADDVFSY